MGKNPAFQFYPSDWTRDLDDHPLEIEGAWIRICCRLWWSATRGELTRNIHQWSTALRTSDNDTERILNYISMHNIGDVSRSPNGDITVISRRMKKDEKERELNRLRQTRYYERNKPNAHITPVITATSQRSSSSSSSSSSKNKEKNTPLTPRKRGTEYSLDFQSFWNNYPKKVGKDAAWKAWQKRNGDRPEQAMIISALNRQKESEQWIKDGGQYIPNPATWLNQGRWADETKVASKWFDMKPEKKTFRCQKCEEKVLEVVEHRGQMVCENCLRILAPEIPDKLKGILSNIGK